jgi:hypothetical protein
MKKFEEINFSAQRLIIGGAEPEPTRSAGGSTSRQNEDGTTMVYFYCYDLTYANGEVWYIKDDSPTNKDIR